jgi:polyisoprenoid-binding protein YceI
MRSNTVVIAALLASLSGPLLAAPRSYAVGTGDKNTSITFESESEFENIFGTATEASGSVIADFEGGTGAVEIAVPLEALHTGIELRDKHLKSSDWLDGKKHPEIRFVSRQASKVDDSTWRIEGDLTLHGVTRSVTVEAKVRAIGSDLAKSAGLGSGEWLRVQVPFDVRLSEYGVDIPKKLAGRVNDEWKIRVSLFAQARS